MKWLRSPLTDDGYETCIGSGWCCKKARCDVGIKIHGPGANCPSLVYTDGRYRCGEVLRATGAEKEALIQGLHIGAGCCANLNSDRQIMLAKMLKRSTSNS